MSGDSAGQPGVEARFRARRGALALDVEFSLPPVGITALFGPSGAGKTSVLRCLAGLEPDVEGRMTVDGAVWQDDRRHLPTHRRSVGVVFQESDLFPHLDVRRNLEYGLRRRPAEDRRLDRDEVIGWLGLELLLDRRPAGLSGGERQRVALGRALLGGPRLLLLDEPMAALDEPSRRDIFPYLHSLGRRLSIPVVYVSHSLLETARLADHMIWLVDGRVRAQGPVEDVLSRPGFARWQGSGAGVVVEAVVREHDEAFHLTGLDGPWGPLWVRRQEAAPGERVRVELLASDVTVARVPDRESSVLNQFEAVIAEVAEGEPGEALVRMVPPDADGPALLARVTTRSAARLGLEPGSAVWARVKSVAVLD